METAGVEPAPPRCKRGVLPEEPHPQEPRPLMGPSLRPSSPRVSRTSEASAAKCLVFGRCGRVESNHHSQRRRGYSALSSPVLSVRRSSAGGIRTHGLELMRLARTAPPLPREVWLAGVEPAISGAQNRRGGLLPYSQRSRARPWRRPESTTVESNHAPPPYQSGACPAGPSSMPASPGNRTLLAGSQPGGSLLAVRRQSRREESNPRTSRSEERGLLAH